ncbi:MAG: hypothetical protein ACQEUT_17985 [Bacillota bacterium]
MQQKQNRPHPFDLMVMGRREDTSVDGTEGKIDDKKDEEASQENGDLMLHIETLMNAVADLKPLVYKVMPFINKWTKS